MRIASKAALTGFLLVVLAGSAAEAKDPFKLVIDQARILRTNGAADTIVIGNPMIADATVRDAQTLILTGRTFGTTNLIVLNAQGQVISEELLTVESGDPQIVTVFKNSSRTSYSCSPVCEPTLIVGDNPGDFEGRKTQITDRNSLSAPAGR